jgi:hypothetical protein
MIPIKIECGCGQRYAFDAEPVAGRLAAPVNCPACGADGTAAANEVIARSLPEPTAAAPAIRIRVNLPAAESPVAAAASPARSLHASQLGLVDRPQAELEARAKASWGDPPEAILQYLMIQGFNHEEASALIKVLFRERALAVRARGAKKIVIGILLLCAGGAGLLYLLWIKIVPVSLMGILLAAVLYGGWLLINGIIMLVAPRMQSGDVAEG